MSIPTQKREAGRVLFRTRLLLIGALWGLFPVAFVAGGEAPRLLVQWDNDLLAGSDRDYTNGVRVAWVQDLDPDEATHNWLQKALYRFSGVEDDAFLGRYRYQNEGPDRFSWGLGISQLMFTPDDPTALAAPNGQRPYAGWLGLEVSLHVKNAASANSVTLSLGTTGANSYGEDAQTWIHEHVSDSPVFQGWSSQVPGEMTLNLHLDHKQRLGWPNLCDGWPVEIDGYTEWGGALGNLRTAAYVGGLLRAGYNLSAAYTTPRVQIGSYGHALFEEEDTQCCPVSIFCFAGIRAAAVLHDITLDGPVFREFDTGVDREPLVGELLAGVGVRWGHVDLSLSRTFRTNEFKGQNENQQFASVRLRFRWPF